MLRYLIAFALLLVSSPCYAQRGWGDYTNGFQGSGFGYQPQRNSTPWPYRGIGGDYRPYYQVQVIPVVQPAPVILRVHVPLRAKVFVDGTPTTQKGLERIFVSPPIDSTRVFTYQVTATWGRHAETRQVRVTGGQTLDIYFRR